MEKQLLKGFYSIINNISINDQLYISEMLIRKIKCISFNLGNLSQQHRVCEQWDKLFTGSLALNFQSPSQKQNSGVHGQKIAMTFIYRK